MQCEQMAKAVGMVLTRTALAFAASASTLLVVLLLFDAYWQYITGHSMSLPLAQSNSRHQQADRAIELDHQPASTTHMDPEAATAATTCAHEPGFRQGRQASLACLTGGV